MSQHSGSVSPLSEHPASPALLTSIGPHRLSLFPLADGVPAQQQQASQGWMGRQQQQKPLLGCPCGGPGMSQVSARTTLSHPLHTTSRVCTAVHCGFLSPIRDRVSLSQIASLQSSSSNAQNSKATSLCVHSHLPRPCWQAQAPLAANVQRDAAPAAELRQHRQPSRRWLRQQQRPGEGIKHRSIFCASGATRSEAFGAPGGGLPGLTAFTEEACIVQGIVVSPTPRPFTVRG